MWKQLDAPWQWAFEQAWEAFRNGSIPIGAAIVDGDGILVSKGRNRIYDKIRAKNPFMSHAEMGALLDLDAANRDAVKKLILFTTMEPCPMCMGSLVMTGIRRLRVAARDPYCGAVHYCQDDPYIASKHMDVAFAPPLLETVQLALQSYYEYPRLEAGKTSVVVDLFERDNPRAVAIARILYRERWLDRKVEESASMSEIFDYIAVMAERGSL